MSRADIINSEQYKVSRASVDWYQAHQDADCLDGFEAGAEWQREQIMKDAADGWMARDKDCDIAIFREVPTKDVEIGMWKPCKSAFIFLNKDEYPDVTWNSEPQKVKVIIIKE